MGEDCRCSWPLKVKNNSTNHYFRYGVTGGDGDLQVTNSMELSPFSESDNILCQAANRLFSVESEGLLPRCMSWSLLPIWSQMNRVHALPPYFHNICFNIILPSLLYLGFQSCPFSSGFSTRILCAFPIFRSHTRKITGSR